ncbi:TPA: hypothetical protein ACHVKA_003620 [Yersinia enterocolitica]
MSSINASLSSRITTTITNAAKNTDGKFHKSDMKSLSNLLTEIKNSSSVITSGLEHDLSSKEKTAIRHNLSTMIHTMKNNMTKTNMPEKMKTLKMVERKMESLIGKEQSFTSRGPSRSEQFKMDQKVAQRESEANRNVDGPKYVAIQHRQDLMD